MNDHRHFGLSIPTQRRLFAVHLNKTTDRPVDELTWGQIAGALAGWLIIFGLLFAVLVAL